MKNYNLQKDKVRYEAVNEINSFAGRVYSLMDFVNLYNPNWEPIKEDDITTTTSTGKEYNLNKLFFREIVSITGAGDHTLSLTRKEGDQTSTEKKSISTGYKVINIYRVDVGGLDNDTNTNKNWTDYLIVSSAPASAYQYTASSLGSSLTYFIDENNTLTEPQTFTVSYGPLRYFTDKRFSPNGGNSAVGIGSSNTVNIKAKITDGKYSAYAEEWPIIITPTILVSNGDQFMAEEVAADFAIDKQMINTSNDPIFGSVKVPYYTLTWKGNYSLSKFLTNNNALPIVI